MVNTRSNNTTKAKEPFVSQTKKINTLVKSTTEQLINGLLDSFIEVEILSNAKPHFPDLRKFILKKNKENIKKNMEIKI